MPKLLKYCIVFATVLGLIVIAAVVTLTTIVDVESYKPKIEQLVTEKTGYPLILGGKISLSFFPWVGLSFTDLRLDNPKGFANKTFVTIDSFQARLKVLPLLFRKVEISSFVVKRPEIYLEKTAKGVWNWEKLTQGSTPPSAEAEGQASVPVTKSNKQPSQESKFALQSFMVTDFSITDGRVQINDLKNKIQRELSSFTLKLDDVSFDKPIKMNMAAVLDGKPVKIEGVVGPLGPDPGMGKVNLDLTVQALKIINLQASGYLDDIKQKRHYNLAVNIEPFSPKRLFASLGLNFPVTTADPQVLENLGVKAKIVGDPSQIVLSDGNVLLDDSAITMDFTAKNFSHPDLAINMGVDSIDLDRYLPPEPVDNKATSEAQGQVEAAKAQSTVTAASAKSSSGQVQKSGNFDYSPLRKLVLKASVKLAKIKVHGGSLSNMNLNVTAQDGLFTINPLAVDLYQGKIAANGEINIQKNTPATEINLTIQDVQVGPLLKDFAQKEIIEGTLKAQVAVSMRGDNGELIKSSLNGKGDLRFQDGALIGLDLAQLARTIKAGFTLEQQQGEKPKTDFAELHAPFTLTNGLLNTSETTLQSPFLRVTATGDASLVSEVIDMKIKPTIVGTIKGQGDEEKRAGLSVPVLVGGTFKHPKFTPDLESLVKDQMLTEKELGELIKTGKVPPERKEKFKKDVEQAKDLLKGLFGK